MPNAPILFAAGDSGLLLTPPESATVLPLRAPVDTSAPRGETEQLALIQSAFDKPLSSPSLKEAAKGKRRVAIIVGDLALPAPYELALKPIVATLLAAEIRPTRIAFIAAPGGCGPLLGRAAIHRYGEEWVGDHEFHVWSPDADGNDPIFAAADLRVAVAPKLHRQMARSIWNDPRIDATIELDVGRKVRLEIAGAEVRGAGEKTYPPAPPMPYPDHDVFIASGGGGDWEATLEEALLSLHWAPTGAKTAVLVFGGSEGLGSARFTQDLWTLIDQAEDVLIRGGLIGAPAKSRADRIDPADVVAESLRRFENVVLLSPGLFDHSDGDEFIERLADHPSVAARLAFLPNEAALWTALEKSHGASFRLFAEPLGWRGQ